ncbi:hypothetical protein GGS20DRAFT_260866 [Poronia punctata]|nr:hypothetical protein GGS20DRAFT_260866 [Poronia punctata]
MCCVTTIYLFTQSVVFLLCLLPVRMLRGNNMYVSDQRANQASARRPRMLVRIGSTTDNGTVSMHGSWGNFLSRNLRTNDKLPPTYFGDVRAPPT